MKLTLSAQGICRTPIFSINEELETVWNELKGYIHESSPVFFEVIKNLAYEELQLAEPKIRFTIWKYFNRARFRATPYGNFAAFTLVPVSRENHTDPIVLQKKTIEHRFANWQEKENVSLDPRWLSLHANYFRSNTTSYRCGDELRFVNIADGSFELSAVEIEDTTMATLDFCLSKRTLKELQTFLQDNYRLSRAITNFLLEQLIGLQLLLTDFQPNIIGTDYFSRIAYPSAEKKNDYIIAERSRINGHLSEKNLQVLIEVTDFLCKHSFVSGNPALKDFMENFIKRFDNKEVPLLVVMDPEIGIGYKSLAHDKEEDQLVQDLKIFRKESETAIRNLKYSPLYQFILNEMVQHQIVQLIDFKDSTLLNKIPVANTMSVMLQYTDEHLIIEQIGGSTANSLLGRFSMASDEITQMGIQYADLERYANPGVMFFDIAYQIEKNTDNINRRKSIYNCELPILSWPESEQVLDPNDVMVSVKGDEIILHSVKYGKRLVPKLASAYNYARSDLAIYRFLSDLQHQNLNSNIGINIVDVFPGLSHYQRIQYKHVVLSAEKWLVPKAVCMETNTDLSYSTLKRWLIDIQLNKLFKCGFADQTLIFNPDAEEDLRSFLLFCRNKTGLYIEEAFIPDRPLVNDENHQGYVAEFIVNLEHENQLYQAYPLKGSDHKKVTDTYLPGAEWLYFEIYCHPSKSDFILLYLLEKYLIPLRKKLKNWFFIRYNDPSYHIRLRLRLTSITDISAFISCLSTLLEPYVRIGIIADMQLKTYRRENERYGPSRIELVEKCFGVDSKLVLNLIRKPAAVNWLYNFSLSLLENVCEAAGYSIHEQLFFAENMAGYFIEEMKISTEGFKKINQVYKDFSIDSARMHLNKSQKKKLSQTAQSFLNVLNASLPEEKNTLLSDLFHMHTNRLFSDDQRIHEMVMYHYLTRKLKMKIGRQQQKKE
ncbi:lantibiotic dehydratase [Pedobacter sp. L105]|uniref:lantibiotic dehydratase n=1 Tax=Pedobacter sp. L105 TaxID=1641871 RepID=UPI00131E63AE|nr:lantibiotic dehydratase [Pedobacter sp. L105]